MAMLNRRDVAPGGHPMAFPIGDATYEVPEPDAQIAVTALRLLDIGRDAAEGKAVDTSSLSDGEERDLYPRLIGAAWDDMVADRVAWSDVQAVAMCVIAWIARGRDAAEELWNSGARPGETPPTPANRASRRASGASASTTRKRASGTGTRASKPPAARRGRTS